MKPILTLLLLIPLFTLSQEDDSLTYYQRKVAEMRNNMETTLRESPDYINAQEGIKRHLRSSKNYGGFVLFSGLVHMDLDALNKELQPVGFSKLKASTSVFGFGASAKTNFLVYDFYIMWAGSESTAKRDEEKVEVSMLSALETSWGYPIVNRRTFCLYPYFGISLRALTIEYKKPPVVNTNYTSIVDLVSNDQSVSGTSTRLGVQAGIGFDLASPTDANGGRKVFFIKAGINKPAWRDRFKIEDVKYEPEIRTNFVVIAGVKFAMAN